MNREDDSNRVLARSRPLLAVTTEP